jgi:hypothetical protein
MKSAMMIKETELSLPDWKNDGELTKWQHKLSEVSTKLSQAESRRSVLTDEIQQTEQALIRVRSKVILGEGSDKDGAHQEEALSSLEAEQKNLGTELEALKMAKSQIEREIIEAEAGAKSRALEQFLPLLEQKANGLILALESAEKLNGELQELERFLDSQQLRQQNAWVPKLLCIQSISFPGGISAYKQGLEVQLRKLSKT